jgi:hypothetical protein
MIYAVMGASPAAQVYALTADRPTGLVELTRTVGSDRIVVLTPEALLAEARQQTSLLSAVRPDARVALLPLPRGPLAVTVLGELLSQRQPAPGVVPWVVQQMLPRLRSCAWTGSVTRLARPSPRMAQHLASFVPGRSFVVSLEPARVENLAAVDWTARLTGADRVVVAGHLPPAVLSDLRAATSGVVVEVNPAPALGAVYGTDDVVEICGVDGALPPAPPPEGTCPVCEVAVVGRSCPFCHVAATPMSSGVTLEEPHDLHAQLGGHR